MTTYRVSLYKTLSNDTGHEAEVLQGRFEVEAQSEIEAVKAAKVEYCSLMRIADCLFSADTVKVDRITWDLSSPDQSHSSKVASLYSPVSDLH